MKFYERKTHEKCVVSSTIDRVWVFFVCPIFQCCATDKWSIIKFEQAHLLSSHVDANHLSNVIARSRSAWIICLYITSYGMGILAHVARLIANVIQLSMQFSVSCVLDRFHFADSCTLYSPRIMATTTVRWYEIWSLEFFFLLSLRCCGPGRIEIDTKWNKRAQAPRRQQSTNHDHRSSHSCIAHQLFLYTTSDHFLFAGHNFIWFLLLCTHRMPSNQPTLGQSWRPPRFITLTKLLSLQRTTERTNKKSIPFVFMLDMDMNLVTCYLSHR